ncbi:MAG: DegT/DnrJ/EryC1/StrS family aminotransferase [Planctomycetota bacterium]|nr:DegT/DnrJ/EryC1/StrS family aminotransferase [Planctomycetota bacterium]
MSRIPLCQYDLHERDLQSLVHELRNGDMIGGPRIVELSEQLASKTGQLESVTTSTYSEAARLLLLAMDIHEGDEVILPAFASGVMTQAVISVGATPVYADCHPRTLNIAPSEIESCVTPATRAVIATSVFGNPAGLPQLAALCGLLEIPLLEDVSGGLGSTIDGRPAGSFGWAAIIDLGPRSVIGCGEGGAISTSDQRLAHRCEMLRDGDDLEPIRAPGDHAGPLGLRCHLTGIQAAVVLSQLRRLDEIMESRATVASSYTQRLAGISDIVVPTVDPGTTLGWPGFVVRLDEAYGNDDRTEIVHGMDRHDIGVATPWTPPPLRSQVAARLQLAPDRQQWPVAEYVSQRTIALPMYGALTDRDVGLVTQTLELMMQRSTFRRG